MTTRFPPPPFHFVFRSAAWTVCLAFFLSVSPVVAAEYLGPVFPGERIASTRLSEPLPLPQPNPLLQRPGSRQVVFEDIDPVDRIISQNFLHEEEIDIRSLQVVRSSRPPTRTAQIIDNGHVIFVDDGDFIQGGMWQSVGFEEEVSGTCSLGMGSLGMGGHFSGPIPMTFGMGLFDNLTLFADKKAFKTELNDGAGSFGFGQGINWSTPVTPQGTVTAQYGIRTVQGDIFSQSTRHQTSMTAGVFRRFAVASVQGGVAFDWHHDHSRFGSVNVRQMRCELSARSFRNLEFGFIGGFDVFRDRPRIRHYYRLHHGFSYFATIEVQDYYQMFVRKHLNTGGQVEFRGGATERGDLVFGAFGESAITDRLAVNGGFSLLTPSEGRSSRGNYRESWSLSLGVVLYFRGGAMSRPANLHRPMFDVSGNHTLFTRITGR